MRCGHRAPWLLLCALLIGAWVAASPARVERIVETGAAAVAEGEHQPRLGRAAVVPPIERRLAAGNAQVVAVVPVRLLPHAPVGWIAPASAPRSIAIPGERGSPAEARAPPPVAAVAELVLS